MDEKIPVGTKIRNMRIERGMTQTDLAHQSGLSLSSIKSYESGKRNPKNESINKLMSAIDKNPVKKQWENKMVKNADLADDDVILSWMGKKLDKYTMHLIRSMAKAAVEQH